MNKKTCIFLFSTLLCLSHSIDSFALPKNHQVAVGKAEFTQVDPGIMEVRPSDHAIINYSQFDIGKNEKVKFIQNSSSSCVLNRVQGKNASEILGSLESNGKVFLVNSNGIYFGPDSSVNAGSLIASTLDIKDSDFLQENYQFQLGTRNSKIQNEGLLNSAEGSIALLAPQIQNLGTISAKVGSVVLTSGEHVTLDFTGDGLIQFSTSGTLKEALIEQLGNVTASIVSLKIPAAKKAISEILNLDGMEEGDVFIEENGVIKFASSASIEAKKVLLEAAKLELEGSIDAKSLTDKGGEVHLFGREISLDGAYIDASGFLGGGEVLIGGEYQGKGAATWASTVFMDESSEIYTNALETGNGGLVVLWSQDKTLFDGKIFAQGGASGGDGGLVETSSKEGLQITHGRVDTTSAAGKMGKWLLDPSYVFLGGTSSCFSPTFPTCGNYQHCSGSDICQIDISSITSSSSNVTVQSSGIIAVCGDITMETGASLAFEVCTSFSTNLVIYGNITTLGGDFTVGNEVFFYLNQDTTINTNGGDINIYFVTPDSTSSIPTYNLTMNAGAGNITLEAVLLESINIGSANQIFVYSNLYNIGSGGITFPPSSTYVPLTNSILYSASGPISIGSIQGSSSGGQAVTLSAPTVSIAGSVGNSTSLANFTLSSITSNVTPISPSTITQWPTTLIANSINFNPTISGSSTPTMAINSGQTANLTGNVTFSCPVDGPGSLTINGGSVALNGAIGGNTALANFSLSSGSITSWPSSMMATGALTFTPAAFINSGAVPSLTGNAITFSSTLDGPGGISLNGGTITFAGSVGSSSALASFTLGSGSITTWPSSIVTTNALTLTPNVTLSRSVSLSSTAGPITFLGDVSGGWTFTVDAGPGAISLSSLGGAETFISDVILTGGAVTLNGSITTTPSSATGQLNITNSDTLAINTESISLSGAFSQSGSGGVSLGQDVNLSAIGSITFLSNILGTGSEALTLFSTDSISGKSLGTDSNPIGSLSMTALNASSFTGIVTNGGFIDVNAPLSLSADTITVNSTGGDITFGNTVNAGSTPALTIAAGSGTVYLENQIGNSTPIASLTITGNSIEQSEKVTVIGNVSYTGSSSIEISNGITSNNGEVTLIGPVLVSNTQTIQALGAIDISNGTINTSESVSDALTLTLINSGEVSFGAVGGTGFLGSIIVNAIEIDQTSTVNVTGNISYTASSSINVQEDITTTGGSVTWVGPVNLLSVPITVNAITDIDASNSTINGIYSLTLNSTVGTVSLSEVGNITPIGNLAVTALWIELNGNLLADKITLSGDTTLLSNNSMTANAGPITLSGSVNASSSTSKESLTLDAGTDVVSLNGNFGNENPLGAITISSASSLQTSASIFTAGSAIQVTPPIEITGITSINTTAGGASGGAITFFNSVDSETSTAYSLDLQGGTGAISIGGAIGSGSALLSLEISTGASVALSSITTSGFINITPAVTLNGPSTIISAGGGITFGNTINGAYSLDIQGGSGVVSIGGVIGGGSALSSLQISTGSSATFSNITTAGGQVKIVPPVSLTQTAAISSNGGNIEFIGDVSGGWTFTVDAGPGAISLSSLGGAETFISDVILTGGAVTLNGSITTTPSSATGQLNITNSDTLAINTESISLSGAFSQSGSGGVSLGQDVNLTAVGSITFLSNILGTGSESLTLFSTDSISAKSLGTDSNPIGSLSMTALNASSFTGIVTNGGFIDVNAPLSLSADTITVNSTGGDITFANTVNAGSTPALTITAGSGTVYLENQIGNSTPIASLTITGNSIEQFEKVTVTGNVSYTGSSSIEISNGITSNNGGVTLIGPVLVSNTQTIQALGDIDISNGTINTSETVSDALTLTLISSGEVSFGAVGGTGFLGSIIVNAIDIDQTSTINVTGNISYTASSSINIQEDITTTGGSVTWAGPVNILSVPITVNAITDIDASNSTINGIHSLTLNSTVGTVSLSEVGNITPIRNLAVIALWIELNGDLLTDKITLRGDTTLLSNSSMTANAGPITLSGSVNASSSTSKESLTLDAGTDVVSLNGYFGNENPLGAITISSASSLQTSASIFTAGGAIQVTPPIEVTGITSMNTTSGGASGGAITFFDSVDSKASTSQSLEITAGSASITFFEDIGSVNPLEDFSIVSASEIFIENITVNNDIDILPSITLSNLLTTFTSNSNGNISLGNIDGTTAGVQSIGISTGTGAVRLGVIGADVVLDEVLALSGSSATIHSITTSGAIEINIPIILAASSTLNTMGDGALGTTITLKAIDGTSVGQESLTITTGIGNVVLTDKIGYRVPLGGLDITGNIVQFEGPLVSVAGEQSYHSPTTISQNIVFRSLGDITFDSTVEPALGTPSFVLYPGGATLTFNDSVGDAPFNNVAVFNAGSFYAKDIAANSLVVAGGQPSIFLEGDITLSGLGIMVLDGGPIALGAEVTANRLWMRSYGNISNLGFPMPIILLKSSPLLFTYFNAVGGVVGSEDSPIDINTNQTILVGADDRADFIGDPTHLAVTLVKSNPPCIVTFNDITLVDCNLIDAGTNVRETFLSLPKDLFYITWLYSSWDNLSNPEFFVQEPVNLGMNPRDLTMFYRKVLIDKTDPLIENSILNLKKVTPKEELADWEFRVDFPEESVELELNQ